MSDPAQLLVEHLDIWTGAIERKNGAGRGNGGKITLCGIEKLRSLILDLAVRGKLVPQDPNDEPAADFLKRLGYRPQASANKLPIGWAEAPLSAFGKFSGGLTPSKNVSRYWGAGYPWVSPKDMGADTVDRTEDEITQDALNETSLTAIPAGSLLMVARSGILRRKFPIAIANIECTTNQDMKALVLKSGASNRYLQVMLKGFQPRILTELVKRGMTVESLIFDEFIKARWPIPPLAEQRRIVAKVDELMALCDALEAGTREAMEAHEKLVRELLATLVNSTDADDLSANWSRIEANFDTLFSTEESIDALKQTILDLGVRGRLARQLPGDEPASELLKRLNQENDLYSRSNDVRRSTGEPLGRSEWPFAPPPGWGWARLADLCNVVTDGDHQPPPKATAGVAFLTIGNITNGYIDFDDCRLVPDDYFYSLAPYRTPKMGDILYTVVGATYGRPAIVETDREFCVQRHIAILKPSSEIHLKFLFYMLRSPFVYDQASKSATGTAQPTIALRPLRNFVVPLPPAAEQARIAAKVDKLCVLCDELKLSLSLQGAQQVRLAEQVVAGAA